VYVMDPSNQVLFKRSNEVHGIMDFKTTTPGKYTFIFSNLDDWNDRTVTFALHTFEEKEEQILFDINEEGEREVIFDPRAPDDQAVPTKEEQEKLDLANEMDIRAVTNRLKQADKQVKQILQECKSSFERQTGHNHETAENGTWYSWAIFIEMIAFVGILLF